MHALLKIECDPRILDALRPEVKSAISRAKIYQSDSNLVIEIETEDVSDLRAAINSWLRLVKMCVEINEVLRNE